MNVATVDDPGVIISSRGDLVSTYLASTRSIAYWFIGSLNGREYHIGVGSDVVCSTGLGNARASESGTDSKDASRFFLCLCDNNNALSRKWAVKPQSVVDPPPSAIYIKDYQIKFKI